MTKRKGDAAVTIIIVVVVVLILIVSYFMFFRSTDNENTGDMNNTGNMNNAGQNQGTNTDKTDNQVGIYDGNNSGAGIFDEGTNDNMNNGTNNNTTNNTNNNARSIRNNMNNEMNGDMTITDENANSFYQRVKRGITLNGKLIEVPAEYLNRLTNKIGEVGYELTDDASDIVNSKYDEIEKTLNDNNVSDINDLDASTKDRIDSLIKDIENAL